MATKALYILPHIHSLIHTAAGLGVLLMDTSTLGQVETED